MGGGVVVDVIGILEDGTVIITSGNGIQFFVDAPDDFDPLLHERLLYTEGEQLLERPTPPVEYTTFIGTVETVLEDGVVVSVGDSLVKVPAPVSADEGNTVEATFRQGIVRVISETRLRPGASTSGSELSVFKTDPERITDTFGSFAGYRHVVERAQQLIELQIEKRELLEQLGARPIKGVLFTGHPGTGKTMLARIVAKASGATLYQVSGPQIVSKWMGDSEQLLRTIFDDAATQEKGAVIVFDEIDAIAGQRDNDSHEASKRLVAEFLTQLDGLGQRGKVIVVGTTNRPEDIDVALTRPGRFDWHINFDLPDEGDRLAILEKEAERMTIAAPLPHAWLAGLTAGWSAADLTAVFKEAALLAAADDRGSLLVEDYAGGFDRVVTTRRTRLDNRRSATERPQ